MPDSVPSSPNIASRPADSQLAPLTRSSWRSAILRSRNGRLGAALVTLVAVSALCAGWLAPARPSVGWLPDPYLQSDTIRPRPPSRQYWLGTDSLGRDLLSRALHGARLSLLIGGSAMLLAVLGGGAVGVAAGWCGGWTDGVLMRAVDVLLAFPGLLLAIAMLATLEPHLAAGLAATLGPRAADSAGLVGLVLAVALLNVGPIARQVRAVVLETRQREFVLAARALGASDLRILRTCVLPMVLGPTAVLATLGLGLAILEAAGLSFLGLGLEPDAPEWGRMLADSRAFLTTEPWVALVPGVAISVTVLGFNLLGDALRDELDPTAAGR